jgi:hypothetical protein
MNSIIKNKLFKFLRNILIILIFILLIGELMARYADAPQPYSALFVYDKNLGYRTPKNTQVTFASGKKNYSVFFDEDGIADRAGEQEAEIIILGDGLTAGLELPQQDRIAHQLSSLLGGKGVVNLSITGYGTIQQALLLEDWLAQQQTNPKQVILIFNLTSDVIDNVREWDGVGNPNVSLLNQDGVVLPPNLPSEFYQKIAALHHKSKLAGYLHKLNHHPNDERIPSQLTGLFTPQLSNEMKYALLGTKTGFSKIVDLSQRYKFKLYGKFWLDNELLGNMESELIANAVNHIQQLTTGIQWSAATIKTEKDINVKAWRNLALVVGTHHANAEETSRIAQQMQISLMMKYND